MARPVVATPAALEGLVPAAELQGWAAREPAELARRVLALLTDDAEGERLGRLGRAWVLRHYDWEGNLGQMLPLLEGERAQQVPGGLEST
jgi:glycosyltransferase involved in cell wall biosynthesis